MSEPNEEAKSEAAEQRIERLRQRANERKRQRQALKSGAAISSGSQQQLPAEGTLHPGPLGIGPVPTPIRKHKGFVSGAASSSNSRTAGGRKMRSAQSLERKYKKPSWYHQIAAKNKLGSISEDAFVEKQEEEEELPSKAAGHQTQQKQPSKQSLDLPSCKNCPQEAKQELLQELNSTGGESNTPAFQAALQKLVQQYDSAHFDPRKPVPRYATACAGNQLEGVGISAGKPSFPGCIGRSPRGDFMYKLGTMSFGMFCPTQLVVGVQGTFVLIDTVDGRNPKGVKNVPQHLLADVRFGRSPVRTYDIVTPFTIEPWRPEMGEDSPNKGIEEPIRGVLTNYGFILPYPTQNRFSVWFTDGDLALGDDQNNEKWFQIFDKEAALKRTEAEAGKLVAAKRLLGASFNNDEMDQDGKLSYSLSKPQATHIDLLYLDKTLQVLRGSSGTVYVHVRLPGSKAVQDSLCSSALLPTPIDPLRTVSPARSKEDDPYHYYSKDSDSKICGVRKAHSASNLRTLLLQQPKEVPTRNPPLKEMESNVVDGPTGLKKTTSCGNMEEFGFSTVNKNSCLKKTSSYGDLEEVGTKITIRKYINAWMTLPKPKSPETPKRRLMGRFLRRCSSDTKA